MNIQHRTSNDAVAALHRGNGCEFWVSGLVFTDNRSLFVVERSAFIGSSHLEGVPTQ